MEFTAWELLNVKLMHFACTVYQKCTISFNKSG